MDIRKIILARLRELGMSRYKLVQSVKGSPQASERAIYDFLAGNTSINSDALGPMLDALKLTIVAKKSTT